jgi:hypothetical protein
MIRAFEWTDLDRTLTALASLLVLCIGCARGELQHVGAPAGGGGSSSSGGSSGSMTNAAWPQAGGPDGTFWVDVDGAPTSWSVASHQNILWQTDLDNEGQGGIAISADLLLLTTFLPFTGSKTSLSIQGYAIDRKTGAIKWRTTPLTGNGLVSGMAYQYSDATSWTPITDGNHVWFFKERSCEAQLRPPLPPLLLGVPGLLLAPAVSRAEASRACCCDTGRGRLPSAGPDGVHVI